MCLSNTFPHFLFSHLPSLHSSCLSLALPLPTRPPSTPLPPSLQVISQNQQAFIDLLNEAEPPASGQPPAPGGAAGGLGQAVPGVPPGNLPPGAAGPMTIQVTPQQKEAIERVSVYFKIGANQLGVESRQGLLQDRSQSTRGWSLGRVYFKIRSQSTRGWSLGMVYFKIRSQQGVAGLTTYCFPQ